MNPLKRTKAFMKDHPLVTAFAAGAVLGVVALTVHQYLDGYTVSSAGSYTREDGVKAIVIRQKNGTSTVLRKHPDA